MTGTLIVEVNVAPTDLTGHEADRTLLGRAGEVLPALAAEVIRRRA